MASFLTDLWESIFTPGPTPSILVATNASFAALQVILLALLVATYSVHFVVLSVLCAGLWVSINWFAKEVLAAQEEQARKAKELEGTGGGGGGGGGASGGKQETEDSDTEVEGVSPPRKPRTAAGAEVREAIGELKQRGPPTGTQSSVSTEDEWEKVSENEQEKDK